MELNLHPIATKSFVSGHVFAEGDRVVSYLVRESTGEVARRDLLEAEDPPPLLASEAGPDARPSWPPAFIYCRWVVTYKQRRGEENVDRALKLTAENLFVTLAAPEQAAGVEGGGTGGANTPLLQFLALMLERKKLIKPRGLTSDGERQVYEHMRTHQLYEVPVGTLDDAFFLKIQEHLDVLVGAPKPKAAVPAATGQPEANPAAASQPGTVSPAEAS